VEPSQRLLAIGRPLNQSHITIALLDRSDLAVLVSIKLCDSFSKDETLDNFASCSESKLLELQLYEFPYLDHNGAKGSKLQVAGSSPTIPGDSRGFCPSGSDEMC
jgi:hypothetical protein